MSTQTSKIVAYGLELQTALAAALAVAPAKGPHDVVQLRMSSTSGDLLVCARDPLQDLVLAVTVGTEMVDVVAERDEVVEISKADARTVAAKKVRKDDDEDDPLVGLIIGEDKITVTDETGFGLGIRQVRVRRITAPGSSPVLGDVETMLSTAAGADGAEQVMLSPGQWKKIAAVAVATGARLSARPLEPTKDLPSRFLLTSECAAMFAGYRPKVAASAETPADGAATEPLSFEDAAQQVVNEKLRGTGTSATVTVIRANPPRGSA